MVVAQAVEVEVDCRLRTQPIGLVLRSQNTGCMPTKRRDERAGSYCCRRRFHRRRCLRPRYLRRRSYSRPTAPVPGQHSSCPRIHTGDLVDKMLPPLTYSPRVHFLYRSRRRAGI